MEKNFPIIPDELRLAVTRRCNGRCRHCYNRSGQAGSELSTADLIGVIKELHRLNPNFDRITLTGGEPMSEKGKVLALIGMAHGLGIRVRLVTRGWELDAGTCRELVAAGLNRVQIGLDSSGAIPYKDHRGRNWDTLHSWLRGERVGFTNTLQGIRNAVDASLNVSIRYSLCRSNQQDVLNTYERVASLGVSKFKFRTLFPDGRATENLIPELIGGAGLAEAQAILIRASAGKRVVAEITQPCGFMLPHRAKLMPFDKPNAYREPCPCGTTAAYLDANGDVKYCLFDAESLGNIRETGFLELWNARTTNEVRSIRCPLDRSGNSCSAFARLYARFGDYPAFMQSYLEAVGGLRAGLSASGFAI